MTASSPERRAIAQRAALIRSAREIGSDISRPAREAFLNRFLPEPREGVSEAERQRQGHAALRAHMAELAQRSARARRKASEAATELAEVSGQYESLANEAL